MRRRLNAPRRRAPKRAAVEGEEGGVEFQTFLTDVCPMQIPDCVYNCDSFQRKIDLAKLCWHHRPVVGEDSLMLANDTVAALMRCMVDNKYRPVDPRAYEAAKDMQIEGILSNLVRMQSQKQMTLLTARISVAAYRYQLPHNMWRIIHSLAPGLLASIPWTDELIHLANQFRPSCAYKTLDGVGGTCFDNYQRRCQYRSHATVDSAGNLLGMTNWATVEIPAELAPISFNAAEICKNLDFHFALETYMQSC